MEQLVQHAPFFHSHPLSSAEEWMYLISFIVTGSPT